MFWRFLSLFVWKVKSENPTNKMSCSTHIIKQLNLAALTVIKVLHIVLIKVKICPSNLTTKIKLHVKFRALTRAVIPQNWWYSCYLTSLLHSLHCQFYSPWLQVYRDDCFGRWRYVCQTYNWGDVMVEILYSGYMTRWGGLSCSLFSSTSKLQLWTPCKQFHFLFAHCGPHNAFLFSVAQRVKGWKQHVWNDSQSENREKSRDQLPPIRRVGFLFANNDWTSLCARFEDQSYGEKEMGGVCWSVLHSFYTAFYMVYRVYPNTS